MEELSPLEPTLATTHNLVAERLFRARIVILTGEITQRVAANVTAQLLALAGESSDDITVFINSQGGHVEAGDTIHDLVRFLSPRVKMVGDRKSTRLNSSHSQISYAVFCLKKKKRRIYVKLI